MQRPQGRECKSWRQGKTTDVIQSGKESSNEVRVITKDLPKLHHAVWEPLATNSHWALEMCLIHLKIKVLHNFNELIFNTDN